MRTTVLLLFALLTSIIGVAEPDSTKLSVPSPSPTLRIKPYLGLSYGTFMFMGEIGSEEGGHHPGASSPGYRVSLATSLNDFLDFEAYSLFGTVTVNEVSSARRLNFQSEIRSSGARVQYTFGNFFARQQSVTPWVSAGLEHMEFLSKTDVLDAHGRAYHYWSDGTIRNIDEVAINKDDAILLQRDYVYETDLRGLNTEGGGNYSDRTWAIPLGIGVRWDVGTRMRVSAGTEIHLTLSDRIDNISDPEGIYQANTFNDRFLYTSVGISYDLNISPSSRSKKGEEGINDDLMLFAQEDRDSDGVMDFLDKCPETPAGVEVDKDGCPKDGDKDGVADYLDEEPNTPSGLQVDEFGVGLTDDYFHQQYLYWTDSIPWYGERNAMEIRTRLESDPNHWSNTYSVEVAPENGGLTQAEINLLLSFNDVVSTKKDGKDVYLVGAYEKLPEAVQRKLELEQQGVQGSVTKAHDGNYEDMTPLTSNLEAGMRSEPTAFDPSTPVTFRVQIGAYRNELSENIFHNVPDLLVLAGSDGLTRYNTGSYDNFAEAASRKMEMLNAGFDGAFVTAYQNGQRITLANAGLTVSEGYADLDYDVENNSIDPDAVTFTVLLGTFDEGVSTERMNQLLALGDVHIQPQPDGTLCLVTGTFNSPAEAQEVLEAAAQAGVASAEVRGVFNQTLIPQDEAKRLKGLTD